MTASHWTRSGLEMLTLGAAVAVVAYGIGAGLAGLGRGGL